MAARSSRTGTKLQAVGVGRRASPRLERWRKTDEDAADRETMITDLLAGEFSNPTRIVALNTLWDSPRDVAVDIADELTATHCRIR